MIKGTKYTYPIRLSENAKVVKEELLKKALSFDIDYVWNNYDVAEFNVDIKLEGV
jgi:hypothetical protein